ncbi:hypothetical protein [Priestia megaterium]|uniref:Uncharacterized protein n=1 Tax=Priestia megaterium TaxID=1404 RepID=A0A6M6E1I1_PRIMG|nr:hypothetical protein [Priestia megaterium]QJX80923.1 hypothetical protein FDZ14_33060 [Priestia megaterium]
MFNAFSKAIMVALGGAMVWMVYSYFVGSLDLSLKEMLKQLGLSAFFILALWMSLEYTRS